MAFMRFYTPPPARNAARNLKAAYEQHPAQTAAPAGLPTCGCCRVVAIVRVLSGPEPYITYSSEAGLSWPGNGGLHYDAKAALMTAETQQGGCHRNRDSTGTG